MIVQWRSLPKEKKIEYERRAAEQNEANAAQHAARLEKARSKMVGGKIPLNVSRCSERFLFFVTAGPWTKDTKDGGSILHVQI